MDVAVKLDKSIIKMTSLNENDEVGYWAKKSQIERLLALEINRKIVYGYADNPPRLQRIFEVVKQPWS